MRALLKLLRIFLDARALGRGTYHKRAARRRGYRAVRRLFR
ncbi:hypothetical protein [Rubrobacter taiwanensis]|nr:hypothetical protein [Rubrobacter taiwanensis]